MAYRMMGGRSHSRLFCARRAVCGAAFVFLMRSGSRRSGRKGRSADERDYGQEVNDTGLSMMHRFLLIYCFSTFTASVMSQCFT